MIKEYPYYEKRNVLDKNGKVKTKTIDSVIVDGVEIFPSHTVNITEDILIHTMILTYEDEFVNMPTETKRLMSNGDYYIINGNVEQYFSKEEKIKSPTENEKIWDAISYLVNN